MSGDYPITGINISTAILAVKVVPSEADLKINFCVPSFTGEIDNHGYAAMIVLLAISTLIFIFDMYLDLR
jgi:hypothetical protein